MAGRSRPARPRLFIGTSSSFPTRCRKAISNSLILRKRHPTGVGRRLQDRTAAPRNPAAISGRAGQSAAVQAEKRNENFPDFCERILRRDFPGCADRRQQSSIPARPPGAQWFSARAVFLAATEPGRGATMCGRGWVRRVQLKFPPPREGHVGGSPALKFARGNETKTLRIGSARNDDLATPEQAGVHRKGARAQDDDGE